MNERINKLFGQVLESIYEKRKLNKDYQRDLDDLIWGVLGKM